MEVKRWWYKINGTKWKWMSGSERQVLTAAVNREMMFKMNECEWISDRHWVSVFVFQGLFWRTWGKNQFVSTFLFLLKSSLTSWCSSSSGHHHLHKHFTSLPLCSDSSLPPLLFLSVDLPPSPSDSLSSPIIPLFQGESSDIFLHQPPLWQ